MRNLTSITAVALLGLASTCLAQEAHVFTPKQDADFWTPERYADARPMPLPRVAREFEYFLENPEPFGETLDEKLVGAQLEEWEETFPALAEEPTLSGAERFAFATRIFPTEMLDRAIAAARTADEVAPDDEAPLKNRGSLNAFDYTSSRLIPSEAATTFPYSAVGRLFFSDGSSNFACSGAVIGKRIVLTAGHCVDGGSEGGPYENFRFIPAYSYGDAPLGEWEVSTVFVSPTWAAGGDVPHAEDWALLEMVDQGGARISDVTGKLSFVTEKLADNHLTMLGFPGNLDGGQEMHQVQSGDYRYFLENTVLYGSDMEGGSSGGPWVQNFNRKSTGQGGGRNKARAAVVGVTSYGFSAAYRIQGASILTREFKVLRQQACLHQAGNC